MNLCIVNLCKAYSRFVKWLSKNRKLQGIPPSAFFSQPHKYIGEDYIRFCFIKVRNVFFKDESVYEFIKGTERSKHEN